MVDDCIHLRNTNINNLDLKKPLKADLCVQIEPTVNASIRGHESGAGSASAV